MTMQNKQQVFVGIDFGTTKTFVFHCSVGGHDIFPFGKEIPTVMAFPPNSEPENWIIGKEAKQKLPPQSKILDRFKMSIESTGVAIEPWQWRNADYAGRFLADLRKQLDERFLVKGLTITVPAEWSIPKRQATLYAAHLANFQCPIALLEEPLAAFLRFYDINSNLAERYRRVLVFDFGGGTCDISLIDLDRPKPKVLKSKTITIGGGDIDELVVRWWLNIAKADFEKLKTVTPSDIAALRFLAEDCKIIVSDDVATRRARGSIVDLSGISESKLFEFQELTRPSMNLQLSARKLQDLIQNGINASESYLKVPGIIPRIEQALEDFLKQYDPGNQASCVILSGGTCRLWVIQDFLRTFFKNRHRSVDFLPELEQLLNPTTREEVKIGESVGRGAALHQYYLNQRNQVAIPSLNHPVEVIIQCDGRELQKFKFPEGTNLPIPLYDIFKNKARYIYPFAKGKNFQISVLHDNEQVGSATIPTDKLSWLSELAWLCSINEYGLVQFHIRIIDVGSLTPLGKEFYLYPAIEDFAFNKNLFERQRELGICGG